MLSANHQTHSEAHHLTDMQGVERFCVHSVQGSFCDCQKGALALTMFGMLWISTFQFLPTSRNFTQTKQHVLEFFLLWSVNNVKRLILDLARLWGGMDYLGRRGAHITDLLVFLVSSPPSLHLSVWVHHVSLWPETSPYHLLQHPEGHQSKTSEQQRGIRLQNPLLLFQKSSPYKDVKRNKTWSFES